jgi:hypothetical protein
MSKKKQTLLLEYDYDFRLFGIVSQVKDYRLCYALNEALQVDLRRSENLDIISSKQKEKLEFSLYLHQYNEEKQMYVISNKASRSFLIPEQSQVDYFLMLKGGYHDNELADISDRIRNIRIVLGIYPISVETLRSKENFIF